MVDLVGLWGSLVAYTVAARRVDRPAAWLTVPYLGWVSYAGYLNAEILRKNSPVWRRVVANLTISAPASRAWLESDSK